jgi:hypothetical protein
VATPQDVPPEPLAGSEGQAPTGEPPGEEPDAQGTTVEGLPPSAEDTAAPREGEPSQGERVVYPPEDEEARIVLPDTGPAEPMDAGPMPGENDAGVPAPEPEPMFFDGGMTLDAMPIAPGEVLDATPPPVPQGGDQ